MSRGLVVPLSVEIDGSDVALSTFSVLYLIVTNVTWVTCTAWKAINSLGPLPFSLPFLGFPLRSTAYMLGAVCVRYLDVDMETDLSKECREISPTHALVRGWQIRISVHRQ